MTGLIPSFWEIVWIEVLKVAITVVTLILVAVVGIGGYVIYDFIRELFCRKEKIK